MSNYAVSFALKSDYTYATRYQSLMSEIRATPNGSPWMETTAFVLVTTNETLSQFADRLYLRTTINSATDILLVFDPATSSAIARGPIQYPTTLGGKFRHFVKK